MCPICSGFLHLVCTSWNEEAAGAHPPAPSWPQAHRAAPLAWTCPAPPAGPAKSAQLHGGTPCPCQPCEGSLQHLQPPPHPFCAPLLLPGTGTQISQSSRWNCAVWDEWCEQDSSEHRAAQQGSCGQSSSHHLDYRQTTSKSLPATNEDVKTRLLCELKHSCQERLAKWLGTTPLHANSPSALIWKETVLIHAGTMWFMCGPGCTTTAYSDTPTWIQLFRWRPTF